MKSFASACAVLALAAPLSALELSLEQNRTLRGSVGYVDMQRIFAESPDSAQAKESFEAIVRQAEDKVNLKRAEILKLQRQLEDDKAERVRLSKEAVVAFSSSAALAVAASSVAARPPAAAPAVPPVALPPVTPATAPAGLLSPAALMKLSAPAVSTTLPTGLAPAAALPGLPAAGGPLAAPAVSSAAPMAAVARSTASVPSTAAAPRPVVPAVALSSATRVSPAAAAPASPTPSVAPGPPSLAVRALDLDNKIIALQAEILSKEQALATERNTTDRGLVSIEGRKTDRVLANIYRAITAVAQEEGISIVIDRASILYGHQGVDLTDKVLHYLRSSPP
ncbi:MAG: hypothetical protein HKL90_11415 [Elusimicrobia bacterium]|nr:hypothetical protein [Elusimicrobiota bacterium]